METETRDSLSNGHGGEADQVTGVMLGTKVTRGTFFQYKKIHKVTWKSPDGWTEGQTTLSLMANGSIHFKMSESKR